MKKENGITLIALIITIVVMLILAGVTLSLTIGNNGIITKTSNAKTEYENAKNREKLELLYADTQIDNLISSEKSDDEILTSLAQNDNVKNVILVEDGIYYIEYDDGSYYVDRNSGKVLTDDELENIFNPVYGTFDIVWLSSNGNTVSSTPNAPDLYTSTSNPLTPIKFSSTGDVVTTTSSDSDWYNYQAANGTSDNTSSKWANAQNASDGSQFVWIPRFAYRIIYYDSEDRNNIVGYYDGRGLVDKDGNAITNRFGVEISAGLDSGVNTVTSNGNSYIVHPAFDNSIDNGGWSQKLTGFWVTKFEVNREDYDSTSSTWKPTTVNNGGNAATSSTIRLTSKPNVPSWRSIRYDNCYKNAYNYDREKESHLMKNSEWGAMVYLAYSQYGRNGHPLNVNNSSTRITGSAEKENHFDIINQIGYSQYKSNKGSSDTYSWNSIVDNIQVGGLASSTGNMYGIYDIVGGGAEYMASYYYDSSNTYITEAGLGSSSTKYATVYQNDTTEENGPGVYNVGKVGDATKEVFVGNTYDYYNEKSYWTGWFLNPIYYTSENIEIFRRGGVSNMASGGIFNSGRETGKASGENTYRVIFAK